MGVVDSGLLATGREGGLVGAVVAGGEGSGGLSGCGSS